MPTQRSKELMALFGLKYPIFEAPHGARNTTPELAIAVSKAGAMGALALTDHTPASARDAVSKVRAATKGAFFINYILEFPFESGAASLQAALDAGAPIVQFSWGLPPKEAISAIRAAGAKLGMQVTSRESAKAALDLGADYLVCQGTEAGGHVQATRGLYEALPKVLEEAKQKPVIASGGIGNGEGIRKALLAGASAAMLGTRFVATIESNGHPVYKQAILEAHAHDTALTVCFQDGWPATHRALRNRTFVLWDAAGCPPPGKRPGEGEIVATRPDGSKALRYDWRSPFRGMEGAVTECPLYAGLSVDFVKDLPAAGELVERLWQECKATHLHHTH
ncbi:MAG: 2-nitropropane dioxygenase [Verrucomicrobia bacterium]|nr:MAG: 2-nitropropane dioxygenase [Verrucomicrobiota bacterium]